MRSEAVGGRVRDKGRREGGSEEGARKGARDEGGNRTRADGATAHILRTFLRRPMDCEMAYLHVSPYPLLLLYFTPSLPVTGHRCRFRTASLWSALFHPTPLFNGNCCRFRTASPWSVRTCCSGPWG